MKNNFYITQLGTIERLNADLQNNFSNITASNFHKAVDSFTSFFVQCYHLKDWLIQSGFNKIITESYVQNDKCLSKCRDIANKHKHLNLNGKTSIDFIATATGSPFHRYMDYFDGRVRIGIGFWQKDEKIAEPTDALNLASSCVTAWKSFINSQI